MAIGEAKYFVAKNDFGPASIDGWLARVAGAELGMEQEALLDTSTHELILDDRRVSLTPLEFDFLHYVQMHTGKSITRAELIEHV